VNFTRRNFLLSGLALLLLNGKRKKPYIFTVNGPIETNQLGLSLIHEHILVDFIGADKTNHSRWNREAVSKKVLPYLLEAKKAGVKSFFDCTPAFLGRDVQLLKMLSAQSGLQIITNTGYYGAVNKKYLPSWAFTETAEQLAARWINEFKHGIEETSVKPGFIKISVDTEVPLVEVDAKLVKAAALTHMATGLTICSHTGPATAAFAQLEILQKEKVKPDAFVWVHAQNEKDKSNFIKAAQMGAWVSLDGIGWGDFDNYIDSIVQLKNAGLLARVLISHDAGWYKPDEKEGGEIKGYTNLFTEIIPRLKNQGFVDSDINQLLVRNPSDALSVNIRKNF
jgi:phosphotriesterase-related protein